ncbi:hypothetical protein Tco_0553460, partial [Tanacetum coccineum]
PTKELEVVEESESTSRPIPITIVRPLNKPVPELEMIGSSSRIQLTDTILEVPIPQTQLTSLDIDITLPEQPKSSQVTPKPDRRKGKVTNDVKSPPKLVKASSEVRLDPDEPIEVPFEINGKLYHITNEEIQAHYELEERKQKATEETKSSSLKKDIAEIKSMITEMFYAFIGQSSSTPSSKTPSYTEGKKDDMVTEEAIKKEPTKEPDVEMLRSLKSPPKLVKSSSEVRLDPDKPIQVPFEINGKLYHLTNEEIQAHYELEERKQKADEEAKLLRDNKPELIKVVQEEATKT